jgi:hypothetical protein
MPQFYVKAVQSLITALFIVTLPGKLRARPVQQPATPALIPGNKTIDHSSFSILLIQRNRK